MINGNTTKRQGILKHLQQTKIGMKLLSQSNVTSCDILYLWVIKQKYTFIYEHTLKSIITLK